MKSNSENKIEKKEFEPIVLTGDRPTGQLHLGHYVGSMLNRVALQDQYDTCFYMVADVQALTDNFDNPEKVHTHMREVVLDNLAVGVDPDKTNFFIQSMVPEIAELTVFFMNLVTVNQLSHNPTIKSEIKEKGFTESLPLGFLAYPVSQAADILFCKGNIVPVGEDQIPVLEEANRIANKFNATYGSEVFPHIEDKVGAIKRLVGTDGNAKASKSLGNAIMLADSPEVIQKKVKSMFTCPSKIAVKDKVSDEELAGNVVFQYLDIFDPEKGQVGELKEKYKNGHPETGDSVIKKRLVEVLRELLDPIRERREELAQNPAYIDEILQKGIAVAREHAAQTMREVREVMRINYF